VSAALVKELRTRTGASMGKCRTALVEEDGDIERAVDWLRKRGIRSMERRTAESAEGLLAVSLTPTKGAIVELRSETVEVTQSELFQRAALAVAGTALAQPSAEVGTLAEAALNTEGHTQVAEKVSSGASVQVGLLEVSSVLGEKLVLGQSHCLSGTLVAGYAHPKHADALTGTGRMAAIVAIRSTPSEPPNGADPLAAMAAKLARHIVAAQPRFVSIASVPAEVLTREQETAREAHLASMDPKKAAALKDEVLAKVLAGKTKKFYQDAVLYCQDLIVPHAGAGQPDPKPVSVEKWLKAQATELGVDGIEVEDFRLVCL